MSALRVLSEVSLEYANSYRLAPRCKTLLLPRCEEDLLDIMSRDAAAHTPILGHGNNVILSRPYYQKMMRIGRQFGTITRLDEHVIYAASGASLRRVALTSEKLGLGGFEYLGNIPGSVGGGIVMNAGAFGHEIASVVRAVRAYSIREQRVVELDNNECAWGYRTSIFQKNEHIVLGAYFELPRGDPQQLREQRLANLALRLTHFPWSEPSAGSVFKRPPHGLKIGEMIEKLGHKGRSIGTAQISVKHAGFIVVKRPGQADDICTLIEFMQREIKEHFAFEPQLEQRLI